MTDHRYAHLDFLLGGLGLQSINEFGVYTGDYNKAVGDDEMAMYSLNQWANQYCAEDIDVAIAEVAAEYGNINVDHLPEPIQKELLNKAYEKVANMYGNERICTVLAINAEAREKMGSFEKFSQETREWGKQYYYEDNTKPIAFSYLENANRPPLLVTNTAILEKFVEVARENEVAHNRKRQDPKLEYTGETITLNISDEVKAVIQGSVAAGNKQGITANEANSGVELNERGNKYISRTETLPLTPRTTRYTPTAMLL